MEISANAKLPNDSDYVSANNIISKKIKKNQHNNEDSCASALFITTPLNACSPLHCPGQTTEAGTTEGQRGALALLGHCGPGSQAPAGPGGEPTGAEGAAVPEVGRSGQGRAGPGQAAPRVAMATGAGRGGGRPLAVVRATCRRLRSRELEPAERRHAAARSHAGSGCGSSSGWRRVAERAARAAPARRRHGEAPVQGPQHHQPLPRQHQPRYVWGRGQGLTGPGRALPGRAWPYCTGPGLTLPSLLRSR